MAKAILRFQTSTHGEREREREREIDRWIDREEDEKKDENSGNTVHHYRQTQFSRLTTGGKSGGRG